jgi:hypothetical protein
MIDAGFRIDQDRAARLELVKHFLFVRQGEVEDHLVVGVPDLAFQEDGLFIDPQKSENRGAPALSAEKRKSLWIFSLEEKAFAQNLRGNDGALASAPPEFDLNHFCFILFGNLRTAFCHE